MLVLCEKHRSIYNTKTKEHSELLSPPQWGAASAIVAGEGGIVTFETVIDAAFDADDAREGITPQALTALITRLKMKIEKISDKKHVCSVRGWGWCWFEDGV